MQRKFVSKMKKCDYYKNIGNSKIMVLKEMMSK